MATKTYADLEKKFKLQYALKCKNKAFAAKQTEYFERTSVDMVARQSLPEQAKMADFVTKNTVNTCTKEEVRDHYINNVKPTLNMAPLNQAGLGNIAYILIKIEDSVLLEEWVRYLLNKYK
jgi:hypothetical protein